MAKDILLNKKKFKKLKQNNNESVDHNLKNEKNNKITKVSYF